MFQETFKAALFSGPRPRLRPFVLVPDFGGDAAVVLFLLSFGSEIGGNGFPEGGQFSERGLERTFL